MPLWLGSNCQPKRYGSDCSSHWLLLFFSSRRRHTRLVSDWSSDVCSSYFKQKTAYEIGHFFIDEHRNALASGQPPHPSFPNHPTENLAEQEANLFSSHLLMPAKEYHTKLNTLERSEERV